MFRLDTDYNPSRDDVRIIRSGIVRFNDKVLQYESKSLAIFLKDQENKIHGGILAWLDIDSIYVEILWIDEKLRGQGYGTKLLNELENEALKNRCRYCTLDTFDFQAEGFYLKNGYERLGEIKNYIREYSRVFLRKKIK